ncbi:MAG: aminotransferase class III-fold pyridoxal phosphate-dependent enzyme [Paracoccaceae bacterium]
MAYDVQPNSLENHWMPFTDNRGFKAEPRMVVEASGQYMTDHHGGRVIDGSSGLFCSPAGHCHPKIVEAVNAQMKKNTYTAPFGLGQPLSFALADQIAKLTPDGTDHVFFVNSGSEAVDTALKIVMAYHAAQGQNRPRFVSRERAYHGVNIGGVSLSGMVNNRRTFPSVMPNIVMMRHTWTGEELNVRGQPQKGGELAEDLERAAQTFGGQTIAACFVEPVAGSTGTLVPPVGYLERLREICDEHGILLVFDEVITGFGRTGANFAAQTFGVKPDIMTMAKALTNGSIPMGAVAVTDAVYDAVTDAAAPGAIEFFHGYTYSAHPAACAAGLATLDIYQNDGLFQRAADMATYFQDAIHSLADHPLVKDVRSCGLLSGVEMHARGGAGKLGGALQKAMFWNGLHVKFTGDAGIVAPMFVAENSHIDEIVGIFRKTLDEHA